MPPLSESTASRFVKLMYIGDSGTGKTGSLASLAAAGYKLRILDMDNGVPVLRNYINETSPSSIVNVEYETCRDNYQAQTGGPAIKGPPKAYIEATKLMNKWTDGTEPQSWGEDYIFVLVSLTGLGQAALEWAMALNRGAKDGRQWYNAAQRSLEVILAMLTSETFECNVIVISHIQYSEDKDGLQRGYATAIGKALGPYIPRFFNTMILAELSGTGKNAKRTIRTVPTNLIALKNPAPFRVDETFPLGTGMATLFEKLKEL